VFDRARVTLEPLMMATRLDAGFDPKSPIDAFLITDAIC